MFQSYKKFIILKSWVVNVDDSDLISNKWICYLTDIISTTFSTVKLETYQPTFQSTDLHDNFLDLARSSWIFE